MAGAGPDAHLEEAVALARGFFDRQEWGEAYRHLADARAGMVLDVADLERLAVAAYLTGHDDASDDAWTLAHEACRKAGDETGAGRSAVRLGWNLMFRGDMARAGGWLARANTLLVERDHDCPERGLLLVLDGLFQLDEDPAVALTTFSAVGDHGDRFDNRDLLALSCLGCGQALVAQGEFAQATTLLDEAMVAVTAGEVTPSIAGVVFCAVLLECHKTFDARRAREWTAAFARWCDAQPDLVPYRGQCLVHRSEVLQLGGEWASALEEARRACEALAGHPAIGDAYYQQAEMHRLRGEHLDADAAYRSASRFGREPHPGFALLRLAQGEVGAAAASISRVVEEARDPSERSTMLAAEVEIMLAADDVEAASAAADELAAIAAQLEAPLLRALSDQARGAVLLAGGDARGALHALRAAWATWRDVRRAHQSARVRALMGAACRILGDEEMAEMEFDAARSVFESLGAAPDLARLPPSASALLVTRPDGLTVRQVEVLLLVAAGRTNHEIAEALVVSDHTVRRHLQNIFAKTGVTSRAGATAYAFTHGLI